jgi:hypothetical protein
MISFWFCAISIESRALENFSCAQRFKTQRLNVLESFRNYDLVNLEINY